MPTPTPSARLARLAPLIAVAAVLGAAMLEIGQAGQQGRPVVEILLLGLDRLLTLVPAALPAAGLALACVGTGLYLLPLPSKSGARLSWLESVLFAFGAGAGILSVVFLLTSWFAHLPRFQNEGVVAVAVVAGLLRFRKLVRLSLREDAPPKTDEIAPTPSQGLGVLGGVTVVLLGVAGLLLLAGAYAPPLVYDVTEYHLGAYTDYASATPAGRIGPMSHNFYARFPFPVESLYYAGLGLEQSRDFSPKLLNALFVAGAAGLAWAMAARGGAFRRWRMVAALAVLAHPVMLEVGLDAYIDAGVAFLTVAALFALALAGGWGSGPDAGRPELLPLAGLLLGTALVSKYTVMQLYLLPVALLFLPRALRGAWGARRDPGVKRTFLLAMAAFALPVAAWLGKNAAFYGNPLEPFFVWLFRPGDAADVAREKFYIESHFPQPLWSLEYWSTFPFRFGAFWWPLLAPLALVPFAVRERAWPAARLVLFVAGAYGLWNLVRESQARFLLPCAVVLASVGAIGLSGFPVRWARNLAAAMLLAFAAVNLTHHALKLGHGGIFTYLAEVELSGKRAAKKGEGTEADAERPRLKFYRNNLGLLGDLLADAERLLPEKAKVLMVYEARPYLLRDHETVYSTVWDESPLVEAARGVGSVAELSERLRERGITHVLVNEEELRRFIEQYARTSQLRRLGLSAEQAAVAYYATETPEDLYPPFQRSAEWNQVRPVVLDFLRAARKGAIAVHEVRRPGMRPIPLYLAPLP